ncbi:MAG TPA: hypothetical protein VF187_07305 [Gemmatimonadales bacterium]
MSFPAELAEWNQWVGWRIEQRPDRDGVLRQTKVPVNPKTGTRASSTGPRTWSDINRARAAVQRWGLAGIGFVFSEHDPYVGVDLDSCIDPETGEIAGWAWDIVRRLDSYTEVTPSGRGLHVLIRGTLPPGRRRTGSIEMYDRDRYFTVTGQHLDGTPLTIEDRKVELDAWYAEVFPTSVGAERSPATAARPLDLSDMEILDRAMRASNGAAFSTLWEGDTSAYHGDQSAADLALLNLLAFWTGGDAARMDRLFRQSGLMRPKWDERRGQETYGQRTIRRALDDAREFYTPGDGVSDLVVPKRPGDRAAIRSRTVRGIMRELCCGELAAELILWQVRAARA